MACVGSLAIDEFQFARQLLSREPGQCLGPLIVLTFGGHELNMLEDSFRSDEAHELLWDGFLPDREDDKPSFELCGAHWMDLSALVSFRSRQFMRADWVSLSASMLKRTCRSAHWDPKEISNLFVWRRVSLT